MVQKLKQLVSLVAEPAHISGLGRRTTVYRPEKPLTFVPRTDPNFYFYTKR